MKLKLWIVFVSLSLVVASCAKPQPTATPEPTATPVPGPFTVTVVYTNDGWGYTEACACDPSAGGLARRASYINGVLAENEHAIVVDAGDSLLTLQRVGDREQGRLLAQAYNEMHYNAIALGGMDFRMGLDVLREQIDVADYAVLSANTQDPQTGQAFDKRYVLMEQEGHHIALVGLTDAKMTTEVTAGAVPITDPLEALMEVADEVAYQADVIIVLSHLGMVYDMNLPSVVPEVDLIVSGLDKEVYDPPLTAAGPLIVSAGSRGEFVGRVDMHFDAEGNLLSFDSDMQMLTDEVAEDTGMRQWLLQSGLIPATALKSGESGTLSQ